MAKKTSLKSNKSSSSSKSNKSKQFIFLNDIIDIFVLIILLVIVILIICYRKSTNGNNSNKDNFMNIFKSKPNPVNNKTNLKLSIDSKNNNLNLNHHIFTHQDSPSVFNNNKCVDPPNNLNIVKERTINPLLPPERSFENTYGIPVNISSRGSGGNFQQIGALYKESIYEMIESEDNDSKTPGNNSDSVVLALFGKPTYHKSNKWTYYVTSDNHSQVKLPLFNKGNKCDSQYGCEEIINNDLITIPGYNGKFRAVIYDYDAPKYIPYI